MSETIKAYKMKIGGREQGQLFSASTMKIQNRENIYHAGLVSQADSYSKERWFKYPSMSLMLPSSSKNLDSSLASGPPPLSLALTIVVVRDQTLLFFNSSFGVQLQIPSEYGGIEYEQEYGDDLRINKGIWRLGFWVIAAIEGRDCGGELYGISRKPCHKCTSRQ